MLSTFLKFVFYQCLVRPIVLVVLGLAVSVVGCGKREVTRIDPDTITDIKVSETWMDGRQTHAA